MITDRDAVIVVLITTRMIAEVTAIPAITLAITGGHMNKVLIALPGEGASK